MFDFLIFCCAGCGSENKTDDTEKPNIKDEAPKSIAVFSDENSDKIITNATFNDGEIVIFAVDEDLSLYQIMVCAYSANVSIRIGEPRPPKTFTFGSTAIAFTVALRETAIGKSICRRWTQAILMKWRLSVIKD